MANKYRIIDGELRLTKEEINKVVEELRSIVNDQESDYFTVESAIWKLSVWEDFLDNWEN